MKEKTYFGVKSPEGYYKRSYDTFGGNWTNDPMAAARWITAIGAQRMADKQRKYFNLINRPHLAEAVCVAVLSSTKVAA